MGNCHPQCAGCPTHPQHRQRPATHPHSVWCQSVVAPFEPHRQRLLPQHHRPIAWKTFQGSPHDQRFESPLQVSHSSGTTAPEGNKILQPTPISVGWSGGRGGGSGKGGFLSRKGRGKSSKHIYTNTCVQLCTSILNYVMHAIYNESTFRGGKRRCLEPAFPPLRPLHPPKTLPQL